MTDTILKAMAGELTLWCATDLADATFPSLISTTTEPTGNGVINLTTGEGVTVPSGVGILPIGTGANNAVVTGMRVYGWKRIRPVPGSSPKPALWIPILLVEVAAVLGNITGVDGTLVPSTYFFADTITIVTGNANVSNEILSPTGDVGGHLLVASKGCRKLQLQVDTGANLTGLNALYWPY
jgi:hypothetical protein